MNKEKAPFSSVSQGYDENKLPDVHSSKSQGSPTEIIKEMYLPESAADNCPSEESIERANGLNSAKTNAVIESLSSKSNH